MTRDEKRANSTHFGPTHSGRKLKWVEPIIIKANSSLHGLRVKISQNIKNTIYVYLSPIIFYHMLKASKWYFTQKVHKMYKYKYAFGKCDEKKEREVK